MNINSSFYSPKNNFQNKNQSKLAFGRAFTDGEMDIYTKKLAEARELYNIPDNVDKKDKKLNNSAIILPDFYTPGGTINSDKSLKFVKFMKQMNGINTVQCLPRGPVTTENLSPFSSSPFELGEHLIDLNKINAPDLDTAYTNFKTLPENADLKVQFNKFNKERPYVERYGILEGLKKEYGTDYSPNWQGENSELDKNLYNYDETKEIPAENKARQEELKENHSDTVEFYKFKQFLGYTQHSEAKEKLNDEGIKLFGDCLIGFSHKDEWAFKPAFEEGKTLGAMDNISAADVDNLSPEDQYKINDDKTTATVFRNWGAPCLDFDKLYKEDGSLGVAGKLLKQKFDVFLTDYDGARIDAGWQLSNPVTSKNNPVINAENGNKTEILGTKMLDIMEMSIQDQKTKGHAIQAEDLNIENLGGPSPAVMLTKNKYPHIHITRYAGKDWGRTAFYNSIQSGNDHLNTNTGYKLNGFTIGVGCHDDLSLIQLEKEKREEQSELLSDDMNTSIDNSEKYKNTKFAELLTARNHFFTAPDMIGDERRINNPSASTKKEKEQNWTINIPENYEETYFKNLSEGKGLNTPKSLAIAIRAKMEKNSQTKEILHFLDKAARILKQEGPNTRQEANKAEKEDPSSLGEMLDSDNFCKFDINKISPEAINRFTIK